MARLLIEALGVAGHEVRLGARLRTRDGSGNIKRQERLKSLSEKLVERYLRRVSSGQEPRPDLWFTYHLYYKAPDWIGPLVADALSIPYVVAEASVAHKRAGGPWDLGHQGTLEALQRADLVIGFTELDAKKVRPELNVPDRYRTLPPFLESDRIVASPGEHENRNEIDMKAVSLLAVGMMRSGDKFRSYQALAQAMSMLASQEWHLTLVGDGPKRAEVEELFAPFEGKVTFTGQLDEAALSTLYQHADLMVWPAVNEAYGMALLEAQAAGLPVVAGRYLGVPDVVSEGETGLLSEPEDLAGFSADIDRLIEDERLRNLMSAAAISKVRAHHSLPAAAGKLGTWIDAVHTRYRADGPL